MENLYFCLNATVPIFLTMLLGMFFRTIGLFDEAFMEQTNKLVFVVCLPCLLFKDLSSVDIRQAWDTRFVLFCFCVTAVSILIAYGFSRFLKDTTTQGEFVQASYRSSAAILGISLIQNIYGNAGMAPLMIVSSVPLYNVMAVVVLALMKPERQRLDKALVQKTLLNVLTNPIILGIAAGILWSFLRIPQPAILKNTVQNIGVLATPLGLMVMGASFDLKKSFGKLRPALAAGSIKLLFFAAIFLPLAIRMGFSGDKLIAILVMLGSSTTVSSYIMAKNMGHEGTLTSSSIMLTTFFSAFTLTGWLYLLRIMNLI